MPPNVLPSPPPPPARPTALRHPPYPRPVSPLHYEPFPTLPGDILIAISSSEGESESEDEGEDERDEGKESVRAAKRRRIERLGEHYLRGGELAILTAGIRGPLGARWRNPWVRKGKGIGGRGEAKERERDRGRVRVGRALSDVRQDRGREEVMEMEIEVLQRGEARVVDQPQAQPEEDMLLNRELSGVVLPEGPPEVDHLPIQLEQDERLNEEVPDVVCPEEPDKVNNRPFQLEQDQQLSGNDEVPDPFGFEAPVEVDERNDQHVEDQHRYSEGPDLTALEEPIKVDELRTRLEEVKQLDNEVPDFIEKSGKVNLPAKTPSLSPVRGSSVEATTSIPEVTDVNTKIPVEGLSPKRTESPVPGPPSIISQDGASPRKSPLFIKRPNPFGTFSQGKIDANRPVNSPRESFRPKTADTIQVFEADRNTLGDILLSENRTRADVRKKQQKKRTIAMVKRRTWEAGNNNQDSASLGHLFKSVPLGELNVVTGIPGSSKVSQQPPEQSVTAPPVSPVNINRQQGLDAGHTTQKTRAVPSEPELVAGEPETQSDLPQSTAPSRFDETGMPPPTLRSDTTNTALSDLPSAQQAPGLQAPPPSNSIPSTGDKLSERAANIVNQAAESNDNLSSQAALAAADLQLQQDMASPATSRRSTSTSNITPFSALTFPQSSSPAHSTFDAQEFLDAAPVEILSSTTKVPLNPPGSSSPGNVTKTNQKKAKSRKRASFTTTPERQIKDPEKVSQQGSIKSSLKVSKRPKSPNPANKSTSNGTKSCKVLGLAMVSPMDDFTTPPTNPESDDAIVGDTNDFTYPKLPASHPPQSLPRSSSKRPRSSTARSTESTAQDAQKVSGPVPLLRRRSSRQTGQEGGVAGRRFRDVGVDDRNGDGGEGVGNFDLSAALDDVGDYFNSWDIDREMKMIGKDG